MGVKWRNLFNISQEWESVALNRKCNSSIGVDWLRNVGLVLVLKRRSDLDFNKQKHFKGRSKPKLFQKLNKIFPRKFVFLGGWSERYKGIRAISVPFGPTGKCQPLSVWITTVNVPVGWNFSNKEEWFEKEKHSITYSFWCHSWQPIKLTGMKW